MPPVNIPSAPPKTRSATSRVTVPKIDPEKIQREREEAVQGVFQILGAVCVMTGQLADAAAFRIHGPNVSHETAALSSRYEKVGNVLDSLSQVGPFTAILTATIPLFVQLAANHKRISPEKAAAFGAKTPAHLDGMMRAELAREQLEYERAMKAEEAAMAQMMKDMEEESVPA